MRLPCSFRPPLRKSNSISKLSPTDDVLAGGTATGRRSSACHTSSGPGLRFVPATHESNPNRRSEIRSKIHDDALLLADPAQACPQRPHRSVVDEITVVDGACLIDPDLNVAVLRIVRLVLDPELGRIRHVQRQQPDPAGRANGCELNQGLVT